MSSTTHHAHRKPLTYGELDPDRYRRAQIGMVAWIWQRVSALLIILFLGLHLTLTYIPLIQFLLLLTVTFHAALGVRVILLDFNLVNVKYHKLLAWGLTVFGTAVTITIWLRIY